MFNNEESLQNGGFLLNIMRAEITAFLELVHTDQLKLLEHQIRDGSIT